MSPIAPDSPQLAGDYWVLPSVDDASGGVVRLHVAIAVGDPLDLQDADVQVELFVDDESLAVLEGPAPGPLPVIQLNGLNAYAMFLFDNPGDPPPTTAVVSVRGESFSFDVSIPIV
jgi:hypothetical protein